MKLLIRILPGTTRRGLRVTGIGQRPARLLAVSGHTQPEVFPGLPNPLNKQ